MECTISEHSQPLILVGPTGSGKTTVGRLLALEICRPFLDMDREIEIRCGCKITLIFDVEGEKGFRERESRVLEEFVDKKVVIATGAGIVLSQANRKILSSLQSSVIWLQVDLETQINRLRHDKARPLLHGGDLFDRLGKMARTREPLYAEVSGKKVETVDRSPLDVTQSIRKQLMVANHSH